MQAHHHLRLMLRRNPPTPHQILRRRLKEAMVLVGIVDVAGTLLILLFEDDAKRSEIHNLWDAFFFSTVQLLTVSSQMRNPVTTGGRIVDIFLELTALCLVTGIAGAFASFFLHLGDEVTTVGEAKSQ
ncbi:MAG TPA: ion channel [Gaiellaceae bacterium]|nr:ion channel [Gaiellaceae bacterium]